MFEPEASGERWVLAFDAACGTCRAVSHTAREACGDRLEILPLADPDVQRWRTRTFGENAPFKPTLVRVRGEDVRAWTSWRLALPLTRHLGVRTTLHLLRLLGELSRVSTEASHPPAQQSEQQRQPQTISRKNFLRIAAGAAAAAGFLTLGQTPASAKDRTAAAAWVAANRDKLPQTYVAFTAYSVDYRREIYGALSGSTRAGLWRDHLAAYRSAHPSLSAAQRDTLALVERFIADDSVFDFTNAAETTQHKENMRLEAAVIEAFGKQEASTIIATLGPSQSQLRPTCTCSTHDDWCGGLTCIDGYPLCTVTVTGCGFLWQYGCNGSCQP